jgi:hypothetical protein
VTLTITKPDGQTMDWILAESWWADVFLPATFGQLVRWGLLVGPVIVATHVSAMLERLFATINVTSSQMKKIEDRLSRPLRFLAGTFIFRAIPRFSAAVVIVLTWTLGLLAAVGLFALVAAGAFLLEAVALLLLLLAVIPVPWIRNSAVQLQRGLANGLGDSYVLVQSPFQYAAMMGRVQTDVAWLADRCGQVVVAAHSQGAAVAYDALRLGSGPKPRLLITFGQGIKKLKGLFALQRRSPMTQAGGMFWMLFGISTIGLLALGASTIIVGCRVLHCDRAAIPTDLPVWGALGAEMGSGWFVAGAVAACIVLATQVGILFLSQLGDEKFQTMMSAELGDLRLTVGQFEWKDIYSSADPVPNGPLLRGPGPPGFASIEVRNLGSPLSDHSTYWKNRIDFVSRVALEVAATIGWQLEAIAPDDASRLREAFKVRSQRVSVLTGMRLVTIVSVVAIAATIGRHLPELGRGLISLLPDGLPLLGTIPRQLPDPDWLFGGLPALQRTTTGLVALALIVALAIVWFTFSAAVWSWAAAVDDKRFFNRMPTARYWKSLPHFLSVFLLAWGVGIGAAASYGISGSLWAAVPYLAAVGAVWLLITVFPSMATRSSEFPFAAYSGVEAAMAGTQSAEAE